MNRERTIKLAMLSLRVTDAIPEGYFSDIRAYFEQIYDAGYTEGKRNNHIGPRQLIRVMMRDGKTMDFGSIKEARIKLDVPRAVVHRSIKYKRFTKKGFKFEKL